MQNNSIHYLVHPFVHLVQEPRFHQVDLVLQDFHVVQLGPELLEVQVLLVHRVPLGVRMVQQAPVGLVLLVLHSHQVLQPVPVLLRVLELLGYHQALADPLGPVLQVHPGSLFVLWVREVLYFLVVPLLQIVQVLL